jgi:hypothetical protein
MKVQPGQDELRPESEKCKFRQSPNESLAVGCECTRAERIVNDEKKDRVDEKFGMGLVRLAKGGELADMGFELG